MGYCFLTISDAPHFKNIGVINILVCLVHFCHAVAHRPFVPKVLKWSLHSRQRFESVTSLQLQIRHKVGSDLAVSTEVLYKKTQEPNSRWRVSEELIALLEDKLEFGGGYSVHRVTSVSHQSNTIIKPKYSNHICIITVLVRQPIRDSRPRTSTVRCQTGRASPRGRAIRQIRASSPPPPWSVSTDIPGAIHGSASGSRPPISFPDHVLRGLKSCLLFPVAPYGT